MTVSRGVVLPRVITILLIGGCAPVQRPETEARPPAGADVTSEDIQRVPRQSVEEVIGSRVSGVDVSRAPDGNIRVRIRGASSIYSEPLYVLDGFAIHPGPDGTISGVQPHDIESIHVLKDPADTALYGLRGANGVIVIKTKQGQFKKKKKDTP